MLSDSKRSMTRGIAKIAAVVVLGFIGFYGYRAWQHYQFMDEMLLDEDIAIKRCIESWGGYIEVSREIEARLQQVMPNPKRYIAIKSGDSQYGSYWFGFFGIDRTRGYLLTNSYRYTELIEKSFVREEAEALFDELTQDYDALDDYSDIQSSQPPCTYIKVAFPTTSKQVRIIGSKLNTTEDDASMVLQDKIFPLLFSKPTRQAISNQTLEAYREATLAIFYRDKKAGHTYLDYENQAKRGAENIFFELPYGE